MCKRWTDWVAVAVVAKRLDVEGEKAAFDEAIRGGASR